jgi:REP element-mobilizing transposase RayT
MNRGGAHRTIFHNANDGSRFLELVGDAAARNQVNVLAYCLMPNHYHLLAACPGGGLSDFMHRIGSLYARHHNDRLGRDGPIFRSRFHSLVVDTDDYLACAGRYIHRNPLDIRPDEPLDQYRWSSYRYFVTQAEPPDWLSTNELLVPAGGPARYRSFVEVDTHDSTLDWAIDTAILEAEPDDVTVPHLRRTVMLAMLGRADGKLAERLGHVLVFPSDEARRAALYRMRRHVDARPVVAEIAERAIRLAA